MSVVAELLRLKRLQDDVDAVDAEARRIVASASTIYVVLSLAPPRDRTGRRNVAARMSLGDYLDGVQAEGWFLSLDEAAAYVRKLREVARDAVEEGRLDVARRILDERLLGRRR
jgi:hypothetical protein